jgi:outer membrane lipoprotein-sorting protein
VSDRPDILDQAADALRAGDAPAGPPDDLVAATVAAIDNRFPRPAPGDPARRTRRKRLMRILTFGGVSAGTAAAVLAIVFGSAGGSAADEVKKAFRKAEQAKSARMLIEVDAGKDGQITSKAYLDDGKFRSEAEPVGLVVVVNPKAENKAVMLLTKMKLYRVFDPEKDELVRDVTKNVKGALDQYKIPSDDMVKGLPDEYLDGRKTKVYEMKGIEMKVNDQAGKVDLKLWIDPKTGMPVRSRAVTRVGDMTYTATATYLGFDEELDPKLFDTAVPEGYKPMPEMKKDK